MQKFNNDTLEGVVLRHQNRLIIERFPSSHQAYSQDERVVLSTQAVIFRIKGGVTLLRYTKDRADVEMFPRLGDPRSRGHSYRIRGCSFKTEVGRIFFSQNFNSEFLCPKGREGWIIVSI